MEIFMEERWRGWGENGMLGVRQGKRGGVRRMLVGRGKWGVRWTEIAIRKGRESGGYSYLLTAMMVNMSDT